MSSTTKRTLVPIANGTEDLEVVTIIDVLRRANIEVVVAGLNGSPSHVELITGARGTKIQPDIHLEDPSVLSASFDAVVLAGGMPGATHFHESAALNQIIKKHVQDGKIVAAICASPAVVLVPLGLLDDAEATCFPFMSSKIPHFVPDKVKKSGHLITSQGPGTAMEFALTIADELVGKEAAVKVANGLLVQYH